MVLSAELLPAARMVEVNEAIKTSLGLS